MGIYGIRCEKNQKIYIGSSENIKERFKDHKKRLRGNRHSNSELQKDFSLYGELYFTFFVVEETTEIDLLCREIYYVEFYKCILEGYNKLKPKRDKVESKVKNPIVGINIRTGELVEYINVPDAARKCNLAIKGIKYSIKYWSNKETKNKCKTTKGYIFMKKEIYNPNIDYINIYFPIKEIQKPIPYSERNIKRTPVKVLDIDGNELRRYSSVTEAANELKLRDSKIFECIKGTRKTHGGFKFEKV